MLAVQQPAAGHFQCLDDLFVVSWCLQEGVAVGRPIAATSVIVLLLVVVHTGDVTCLQILGQLTEWNANRHQNVGLVSCSFRRVEDKSLEILGARMSVI